MTKNRCFFVASMIALLAASSPHNEALIASPRL
jgi:hypothetical protein